MGPGRLTSLDHFTGSLTSGSPTGGGQWIPSQGFGAWREGRWVLISVTPHGLGRPGSSTFLCSHSSHPVALLPGCQLSPGHSHHASSSASAAQVGEPLPSVGSGCGHQLSYCLEEASHTSINSHFTKKHPHNPQLSALFLLPGL